MRSIQGTTTSCRICGSRLSATQSHGDEICGDWRCREAVLREDFESFRLRAGCELSVPEPEAWPVAIVPHVSPELVPLDRERKAEFLANLVALVDDSRDVLGNHVTLAIRPNESTVREPPRILRLLCAACQGSCCYRGETHAFLELDTLRQTMDAYGLRLDDLPAAYEARLPAESVARSCVYHAEAGCALPRDMRAKICNTFECNALGDARQIVAEGREPRLFLVRRIDNEIRSGAFVNERRTRRCEASVPAR